MKFTKLAAAFSTAAFVAGGAAISPAQAEAFCPDGTYRIYTIGMDRSDPLLCGTIIADLGSSTFDIPEGVTKVQYIVIGAGGGGGAGGGTYVSSFDANRQITSESGDLKSGGGGGGGTVVRGEFTLSGATTLNLVIGAGGVQGTGTGSTGTNGANGGNSSISDGVTTVVALGGTGGRSGSNGGAGGDNDDFNGGSGLQNPGSDLHLSGGGGGAGASEDGTSATTMSMTANSEGKTVEIVAGDGGSGVPVTSDQWSYFDPTDAALYGADLDEMGYGPDTHYQLGDGGAGGSTANAAYNAIDMGATPVENNGCDWTTGNKGASGDDVNMGNDDGQGACYHRFHDDTGWSTGGQSWPYTLTFDFDDANHKTNEMRAWPGAGGPGGAANQWDVTNMSTGAVGNRGAIFIRFLAPDDGTGGGDNGGAGESAPSVKVAITGYVQQSRSHTNDILLSKKRAKAVRSYLKANGLEDATFTIKGKGVKGKKWNARTAIANISWTGAATGKTQSRIYFDKWSAKLDKGDKKKLKKAIAKVPGA